MVNKQHYRGQIRADAEHSIVNKPLFDQPIQSPRDSPFKPGSHADIFCRVSEVDWKTGYSDPVSIEILEQHGLEFGNGGSWCRRDGALGKIFNIHKPIVRGRIASVQLVGWNKSIQTTGISPKIRAALKNTRCAVLSIGGNNLEIDHKDGRKDDLSVDVDPVMSDFQVLHKSVNIAKREHCNRCVATGIRFDATLLGYSCPQWIGGIQYRGSCVGCYWHDPSEFNKMVSDGYTRSK